MRCKIGQREKQRKRQAWLEIFYKFNHGLVSINSSYMPKPSGSRLSSRTDRTENSDWSYDIPSCRTQYRRMSCFPRTIPDWNGLPEELVVAVTLDRFKSGLASHLPKLTKPLSPPPLPAALPPHPHTTQLVLQTPYNALPNSKLSQTVS